MLRMRPWLWTRYHRQLADEDWLRRLAGFVEKQLRGRMTESAWGVRCTVWAAYTRRKYLGPQSVVKNQFHVKCRWWRGWKLWKPEAWESCRLSVRYVPARREFLLEEVAPLSYEDCLMKEFSQSTVATMVAGLQEGCTLARAERFRCPDCGALARVDFCLEAEGRLFFVSCGADPSHASDGGELAEPPEGWWERASPWYLD
jgi:hypothetical protein